MGIRRKARELAIQVLFHLEYSPGDHDESFQLIFENFDSPENIRSFSEKLVYGICSSKEELDRHIGRSSKNWRIERMSYVDRNILRIAVYEILHMQDIPPKVSIDEAVELGKSFGTDESAAFINGILDNIYNDLKKQGVVD